MAAFTARPVLGNKTLISLISASYRPCCTSRINMTLTGSDLSSSMTVHGKFLARLSPSVCCAHGVQFSMLPMLLEEIFERRSR